MPTCLLSVTFGWRMESSVPHMLAQPQYRVPSIYSVIELKVEDRGKFLDALISLLS